MWNRNLVIALAMAFLMLGAANYVLPATQHKLSPVDPTHASLCDGSTGEGPYADSRTAGNRAAFVDVLPMDTRFGGLAGEPVDVRFQLTEMNRVAATINSFSWRFNTLDGDAVIDGSGTAPCRIDLDALGSTDWTTSITISEGLYRDMILKGRDQLRLTVTFRGVDRETNDLTIIRTIPAHLTQRVAMLVDEDVYPLIKDKLLRYEDDANLRGSVEFIHQAGNWGNAEAIRALLKQLWSDEGITGAILWGYLPFAMWDMVHSDDSHEIFPIPVFYEDMDGSFIDKNGDGIYDKHIWGENDGCEIWTSFVMPPRELVPEENLDPSGQGTGGGLSAAYYNNANQVNWRMNRVDPTLDFYWLEDLPEEIDDDDFSIKWTGRIRAEETETYTLSPLHGGGLRIWIDGDLAHDVRSGATWKKWEHLSTVYMTKGWHDIRIEYNNGNWGFDGAVRFLWTSDHVLAGTINDWLDRSHAYHHGALEYNEEALLFMDYGYGIKCNMRDPILNKHIRPLYGDNVVVKGCTNTTAGDDYIKALEDGYEVISVWSHAGSSSHWISYADMPDDVNGSAPSHKVRETQAGLVTLIWGCHAGDFGGGHEGEGISFLSDNLAANYAFSTPYGLASAAATRSIGTTFKEAYWAWQNGSSLATGFFANLESEYDREYIERAAPNLAEDMWVKDVVLMGDPFIRIDHRPWNLSLDIDDGAELTTDVNVTLHVYAFDAERMRFKNAGGDWTAWEDYSPTKEWRIGEAFGAHRVLVQVRNGWGPAEYSASDVITRVATMSDHVSIEIDDGAMITNSTRVTLSLDLGDANPAMVWMRLKDDGSTWTDWSPFTDTMSWKLSEANGERTVFASFMADDEIWSMDANDSILVDTHPPRTVEKTTGETGVQDWYVSSVTITLNATDGLAGIDITEWSLDDGDWTTYEAPITVAEDGHHQLTFRSVDACGNIETTRSLEFKVDCSYPVGLSMDVAEGDRILNIPSLDLTLAAEDGLSGLEGMRFRIDEEDWGPWLNFETSRYLTFPEEEGTHTIDWQVRDLAGNIASVDEPLTIDLDNTAPMVTSVTPDDGAVAVPVDTVISFAIDEPVAAGTLTGLNILVRNGDGTSVGGVLAYDEASDTHTFTPDEPLHHYSTYRVLLRGEITDLAGNGLHEGAGHIWTFTTVGLPPGAPQDVTIGSDNVSITLLWAPPEDTGTGDLQGYNVYRMRDDGADTDFVFWASAVVTQFEDTEIVPGVQYHYMVRALTSYDEGPNSEVVSIIVVPTTEDPEDPEDPDPDPNDTGGDGDKTSGKTPYATYVIIIVVIIVIALTSILMVLRAKGGLS